MDATPSILPVLPLPSQTPPISTGRLVLLPFKAEDFTVLRKLRTNPEVMKWTHQGRIDLTEDETRAWMNNYIYDNDEQKRNNYNFVVWRREFAQSGEPLKGGFSGSETEGLSFIGVLGVISFSNPHGTEVGYLFLPESWGKGYATEALNGFINAWLKLPLQESTGNSRDQGSLFAVTNKANTGSPKVLSKCGWSTIGEDTETIQGSQVEILKWILKRPL